MQQHHQSMDYFAGEYSILSLIEAGTQAKVYLAQKNDQTFCIKVYRSEKNKRSFENECRILAKIQQKSIVTLIEICRETGCRLYQGIEQSKSFLVMDYYSNGDLKSLLSRVPFPDKIARTLLYFIIKALWFIAEKGVIHRDVKPQNIAITQKFEIKLIDFGLSTQGQSRSKDLIGTLPYIAPQIFTKRQYSYKSDIFSTGVIYYIMITGMYPFASSKMTDRFYFLIVQKRFVQFWQLTSKRCKREISDSTKKIIEGMLAWKPEQRLGIQDIISSEELSQEHSGLEELRQFFKKS